ncbi:MAG: hypothetical protein JSV06_07900 [Myxococcales bacterium]|nr:MAG: hypothetical protein JSV06_07900 [Myxococcales bacterium]
MAVAQEPAPAEEDTSIDEADEAAEATEEAAEAEGEVEDADDVVTEEELDEAEAAIEEAERQLEEARRQMELMGRKMAPEPTPAPGTDVGLVSSDGRAKKLQWSLNDDGTLYFRLAMWLQVWTRAIQMNPGTTVLGNDNAWYGDVGLRRARFLAFGKIFPRTTLLMHFGINNQTFRRTRGYVPVQDGTTGDATGDVVLAPTTAEANRKPQLFFHDAWVEFEASKKGYIDIGAGLLYWNGVSRMTNASTITAMSLDLPITNWPTIELTDQFARQLGLYFKGKAGLYDYRVAVVRPFTPSTAAFTVDGDPVIVAGINVTANTFGYSGYFMFQFLDKESNVLPYTVGTYIGAKRVFNLGFGAHGQPKGVAYVDGAGNLRTRWLGIASGDLFLDIPFAGEDSGAATWYGAYYYQDFGPDVFRNVGIMNPGDGGSSTSLNGPGNAYPTIGTGHTVYSELGILMPGHVGENIKFQPYVNWQGSSYQGLNDGMHHVGAGINMFIHRHNAKVTLEYRNRPIYNTDGNVENRKGNSFVLQMHLFI